MSPFLQNVFARDLPDSPRNSAPAQSESAQSVSDALPRRVCFFHQNDVFGMQGGIERYVSTILSHAGDRAALASPPISQAGVRHVAVLERGPKGAPQWLRYLLGLFARQGAIKAFLRDNRIGALEFSRPEYALAAWLFPGKRSFTIHGTGPGPGHRVHYLIHHACCLLLPLIADRVQVIGRDPSGLPKVVRSWLRERLAYVDAWYDERFAPKPFPSLAYEAPIRVFYAGRVAPQKNPELLFAIIREAARVAPGAFEFHYFGSDYAAFIEAGLQDLVVNHDFLGPQALSEAIASCHIGLLCSAYGEGSPYIVVESLACGRPFVVSSLPTLSAAYAGQAGVHFVARGVAADFVAVLQEVGRALRAGDVEPETIATAIGSRSQSRAVPALLDALTSAGDPELRKARPDHKPC
jgi:glycosyltransferase involved in cell wall biosynthesis